MKYIKIDINLYLKKLKKKLWIKFHYMLETPKALDTLILNINSENSNGCHNGQSAGNQQNKQI